MANLNSRQLRFVEEYLIDLNATQAAIRAGYSAKTANKISARMLVNVGIQAEIERLKADRSERTGITADRVVEEQAKIAFANNKFLHDKKGIPIPIHLLPDHIAAAIASVEIDDNGRYKYRLWDKSKSLSELAAHVKLSGGAGAESAGDITVVIERGNHRKKPSDE